MSSLISQMGDFALQLMSGGRLEIVLLIVLVVVGLILLLVLLWLLWKLLVLLGKGLLWIFKRGGENARKHSVARREAKLDKPPPVSTGWGSSSSIRLRRALSEARRLAGSDALCIVVVAGDGVIDLCRSLGLTPPGVSLVGIAAGGGVILVDASRADSRMLGKLARTLPWRRPVDGVATLVHAEGIPLDAVARAAGFARAVGLRVALHFVLPGASAAWRIIDANNSDGDSVCAQLAADAARKWLSGDSREGLKELALAQSQGLAAALDRAFSVAPSSIVDVASLSFGGVGLRAAVAQTVERTRPSAVQGATSRMAQVTLVAGLVLAAVAGVVAVDRVNQLRGLVDTASREAASLWRVSGIDTIPNGARVRRLAGLSSRLAALSEYSLLMPLAVLVPNYFAPEKLGAVFLDGYLLRPLAAALERQSLKKLEPRADPGPWVDDARRVGEWLSAWEGLADDPREVDLRALLSDAFSGGEQAWPEGIDIALVDTGVQAPAVGVGGLDVDWITERARSNFVTTMQGWAAQVYTNGPVATAARRAIDRSANWREQYAALGALRTALQDPSQQWLMAAEDQPDHRFEMRYLGRALALSIIGQTTTLKAKAAISRIRIEARDQVEYFILPEIGPLLTRANGSSGSALSLTPEANAWLSFLDRVANAGFAQPPARAVALPVGTITVDPGAVAQARRRLRVFEQFSSSLPADLLPHVAHGLTRELSGELVVGVAAEVENAVRLANSLGGVSQRAEYLAQVVPAVDDLIEIEAWLRQRQVQNEADRVLRVRARVAEGVLAAAGRALMEEDPLRIYIDPTADPHAVARRFDRGLARLTHLYEQLAQPFIESAIQGGGGAAAIEWRDMADDLAAYARGDVDSTLSALEGMTRAYAEDPVSACEAPGPLPGRSDYLARTLRRFRAELGEKCAELFIADSKSVFERVKSYFETHVIWRWPYSNEGNAPDIEVSTLHQFLEQVHEGMDAIRLFEEQDSLAVTFAQSARFWSLDEDGAAIVRFRLDWRTRPSEERLAENIAEITLSGAEVDESGIYTWRYGAPFEIQIRLAKNSPYRFVNEAGVQTDQWTIRRKGNGSFLRVFDGIVGGAWSFEANLVNREGVRDSLRVTARIRDVDGEAITWPTFAARPPLSLTNSPPPGT